MGDDENNARAAMDAGPVESMVSDDAEALKVRAPRWIGRMITETLRADLNPIPRRHYMRFRDDPKLVARRAAALMRLRARTRIIKIRVTAPPSLVRNP